MVPADSDRISRVPPYSGETPIYLKLRVRDYHPLWLNFPEHSTSLKHNFELSYNPDIAVTTSV